MAIPTKSIAAPLILVAALGAVFLLLRGPETAPPVLPAGAIADRILVEKAKHLLTLYQGDHVLARYAVALGSGGLEPKVQEGDRRTPEGIYRIDRRNEHSAFHRALHISYPEAADRAAAMARGVDPGGEILIHGLRNGFGWLGRLHRSLDWTAGCIAVTDDEIEAIWRVVPDGASIEIRP